MPRNASTPSSISSGSTSFLEGLQFTPMNMSSTGTEASSDASVKEVQIQMPNKKSAVANALDDDNAITHEPVRKCLFCGHAFNKRSKLAMSLSSVALIIIGIIIIVALFGPMMVDDSTSKRVPSCRYQYSPVPVYYESSGNGIDSAEIEIDVIEIPVYDLCSSSTNHLSTYMFIWYICMYLLIIY